MQLNQICLLNNFCWLNFMSEENIILDFLWRSEIKKNWRSEMIENMKWISLASYDLKKT